MPKKNVRFIRIFLGVFNRNRATCGAAMENALHAAFKLIFIKRNREENLWRSNGEKQNEEFHYTHRARF